MCGSLLLFSQFIKSIKNYVFFNSKISIDPPPEHQYRLWPSAVISAVQRLLHLGQYSYFPDISTIYRLLFISVSQPSCSGGRALQMLHLKPQISPTASYSIRSSVGSLSWESLVSLMKSAFHDKQLLFCPVLQHFPSNPWKCSLLFDLMWFKVTHSQTPVIWIYKLYT